MLRHEKVTETEWGRDNFTSSFVHVAFVAPGKSTKNDTVCRRGY